MANNLDIPIANPIRLVKQEFQLIYNTPTFDEALYVDQILTFQQGKPYYQKWKTGVDIYLQIIANYGPITVKLIDCKEATIATGTVATLSTSVYTSPTVGHGISIVTTGIADGLYYVQLLINSEKYISEPILLTASVPDTMQWTYTNSENDKDLIFQNGETFNFFVESALLDMQTQSNRVAYEDETANMVVLSSESYRLFKLVVGDASGVPDWVGDKMERIFGFDSVLGDGKQYVSDSGKSERTGDRLYSMVGFTFDLREGKARTSQRYSNDVPLNNKVDIAYLVNTEYFSNLGPSGTVTIVKED